jgi:NADH dehydrogenase [ubiquinone] 1 alpha subcomplex assembly factor 7
LNSPALNPVSARLARRIARGGPITIADYMAAALTDPDGGYYRRTDPLGAGGDFTTAPEISQLFGELIGAWLIDCWVQGGRPPKVNLVELGPGRGTLMADALRVGRQMPDWLNAIELHLVEINPALRELQATALSQYRPHWHDSLGSIPDGLVLLVANEFFDALPIRQLVFWDGTWRERLIDWSEADGFRFAISPKQSSLAFLVPADLSAEQGSLYELSPTAIAAATEIAQRIAGQGGAALIVDYGRAESRLGDSLQAVRAHTMVPVLDDPGSADLSAHVDFEVLCRIAGEAGAKPAGPTTQGAFLIALGIAMRVQRLKRGIPGDAAIALEQAVERLTASAAMGRLFKVIAMTSPTIVPAGFDSPAEAILKGA